MLTEFSPIAAIEKNQKKGNLSKKSKSAKIVKLYIT